MKTVTDYFHEERLKKWNINIKTKFQDGQEVKERNSDDSYNDDIRNVIPKFQLFLIFLFFFYHYFDINNI